jgi:hypothetical protein
MLWIILNAGSTLYIFFRYHRGMDHCARRVVPYGELALVMACFRHGAPAKTHVFRVHSALWHF